MKLWAIQWGPYPTNPRCRGWIDHTTVSIKRTEAWDRFAENESPHATDKWKAELKKRRRKGWIKAVRVSLERIES